MQINQEESTGIQVTLVDTTHLQCNGVISAQISAIKQLRLQVADFEQKNKELEMELTHIKFKTLRNLNLRVKRQENALKQKGDQIMCLQKEINQMKDHWSLPSPTTAADNLLLELIKRRNVPKSKAYSDTLKTFAFNAMFISPKGYRYLHANLPTLLPHPSSSTYWMKDIHAPPGTEMFKNRICQL